MKTIVMKVKTHKLLMKWKRKGNHHSVDELIHELFDDLGMS